MLGVMGAGGRERDKDVCASARNEKLKSSKQHEAWASVWADDLWSVTGEESPVLMERSDYSV